MALQSRCPHCGKVLKLKSKAALGKVAPCPKCGERFKVAPMKKTPAPEPEPEDEWADDGYEDSYDEGYDDDDYGYEDEYDDGYDSPAPKRSSGSKKKKGRKKKKGAGTAGWVVGLGIGAGVVAALGLLIGLVMFLMGGGGGGGAANVINLAWLPADADGYIQVKPQEMWNAPILAPLRESELLNKAMQNAAQQGMPIEAGDIETVTMAVVGASDMYQQRQNLFGQAIGQPQKIQAASPKMVGVMRLTKSLADDDLASIPNAAQRDVNGHQLWVAQQGMEEMAYYLADGSTVLFGAPEQVTAAIDRGPTEERVERIDFANPDHQFVMVFAPEKVIPTTDGPSGNAPTDQLARSLGESAKGFSLGLSLTADVELEASVACNASGDASRIQTEVESALAEARSKIEQMSSDTPAMGFFDVSAFIDIGKESVESLSASSSGEHVTVTGRIPGRIATAIQELTQNPMIAAMIEGAIQQAGNGAPGMGPGGMPMGTPPGSGGFGIPGADPEAGTELTEPGYTSPDASEQSDIDAVNQEKADTTETLDGIRENVKQQTGNILTFPGGGQRKLPSGTTGSGGDK